MGNKILVGWLEDKSFIDVERRINHLLGVNGVDLKLMSCFLDVVNVADELRRQHRVFDLLVLDCRMDKEEYSQTDQSLSNSGSEEFRSKAKEMGGPVAQDYYATENRQSNLLVGGLYVWRYFMEEGLLPHAGRRVVLYSADVSKRAHYRVLDRLGLLRFPDKLFYIYAPSHDPLLRWNDLFKTIRNGFDTVTFVDIDTNCPVEIGFLGAIDPDKNPEFVLLEEESGDSARILVKACKNNVENVLESLQQNPPACEFLCDLEKIGMEYARSSVEYYKLEQVLDGRNGVYWDKALSSESGGWTLRALFPAFYNNNAVFNQESELCGRKREELELRLRQETSVNITYELGRVFRTGAQFRRIHRVGQEEPPKAYDYWGTRVCDENTERDSYSQQKADFERRTTIPLSDDSSENHKHNRGMAVDYPPQKMKRHASSIVGLISRHFSDRQVRVYPGAGGPAWPDDTMNFRPVLARYPLNRSPWFSLSGDSAKPWYVTTILEAFIEGDLFKQRGGQDNPTEVALVCGEIELAKEGVDDHIRRWLRFLCLAYDGLKWEHAQFSGPQFMNKTIRGWYHSGIQHHARIFLITSEDHKRNFFDLALGPFNRPDVEMLPYAKSAHDQVLKSIGEDSSRYYSYLYVGYDVVETTGIEPERI